MAKVIVLGAGRVGRVIARDLNEESEIEVTLADKCKPRLDELASQHGFNTICRDLAQPEILSRVVADFDLVMGALPSTIGLQSMQTVIKAKKPYVDISFLPEDPRSLDDLAKQMGVAVIYDIGVAPGMSNILLASSVAELTPAKHARYVVGGLPVLRRWPWEYEAPFAPFDIVEEYTRPARIKIGGEIVTRRALADPELFDIPDVGTLEGFLTDGLRSLLDTVDCPNMEEKTLRYPGHASRMRVLIDSGFLNETPIDFQGVKITPREFTFKLLEPAWNQPKDSLEFTAMQVLVTGGKDGNQRIAWHLLDRTDTVRRESSMARTTGFPPAIVARGILDGSAQLAPGVHPPEDLAQNKAFVAKMLQSLRERGVCYKKFER